MWESEREMRRRKITRKIGRRNTFLRKKKVIKNTKKKLYEVISINKDGSDGKRLAIIKTTSLGKAGHWSREYFEVSVRVFPARLIKTGTKQKNKIFELK